MHASSVISPDLLVVFRFVVFVFFVSSFFFSVVSVHRDWTTVFWTRLFFKVVPDLLLWVSRLVFHRVAWLMPGASFFWCCDPFHVLLCRGDESAAVDWDTALRGVACIYRDLWPLSLVVTLVPVYDDFVWGVCGTSWVASPLIFTLMVLAGDPQVSDCSVRSVHIEFCGTVAPSFRIFP